jgi:hypothetical protein
MRHRQPVSLGRPQVHADGEQRHDESDFREHPHTVRVAR